MMKETIRALNRGQRGLPNRAFRGKRQGSRWPLPVCLLAGLLVTGCDEAAMQTPQRWTDAAASAVAPVSARWYRREQVAKGAALFREHCASCHGADAEGTPSWREPGPDGKYPPPPLNGTAHAWHHPLSMLKQALTSGGKPLGRSTPGFAVTLDGEEIDAVLAWVQSHWSEEIYAMWRERDAESRSRRHGSGDE